MTVYLQPFHVHLLVFFTQTTSTGSLDGDFDSRLFARVLDCRRIVFVENGVDLVLQAVRRRICGPWQACMIQWLLAKKSLTLPKGEGQRRHLEPVRKS